MFRDCIIKPIRDFIYPPVCLVCAELLSEDKTRVCSSCWNSFTRIEPSHPTWIEIKSKFNAEGLVTNIISCYLFEKEGKLQEVIHQLKYQGIKSHGIKLGEEVGIKMMSTDSYIGADFLIPIPLHSLKKRERGYNQSELICKGISNKTSIPVANSIIIRNKYTQTQTKLTLDERKINMSDAFIINPKYTDKAKQKKFILVDDVITTGATINSCAKTLLEHNAKTVIAASVALAE
jgi:competence protein ComFC